MSGMDDKDATKVGQAHLDALADDMPSKRSKRLKRPDPIEAESTKPAFALLGQLPPFKDAEQYNADEVDDFLCAVFHSELADDEHTLCFFSEGKYHGYPMGEDKFLRQLRNSRKPAALYTSTSTVRKDTQTAKLYNRSSQFKRFHFFILDDIGTKIPADKVPEAFKPSYIIETSAGNFQYGYILETPIDDYDQAQTLLQLVGTAKISDQGGGKIVGKEVRLPQGIHGKENSKDRMFRTRLVSLDGPRWTPQAILDALSITEKWENVVADAAAVRQRHIRVAGAAHWSGAERSHMSYDGYIDPVLEWLYKQEKVISDGGDQFVNIQCPNHTQHTDGRDGAFYSPLGWGGPEYQNRRSFNCYHDSCSAFFTDDFLGHVVDSGGPHASKADLVGDLVRKHVFNSADGKVYRVTDTMFPEPRSMDSFRHSYPLPVQLHTIKENGERTVKTCPQHALWLTSPDRVVVEGSVYDPSTRARIIVDECGIKRLNEFSMRDYGSGPINQRHLDMFVGHIEYMVPDREQSEIFIDWLAAKLQDMSFRGWGMIMVAQQQGIGRGTFSNMLADLFGAHNVANTPYHELTAPDGQWNEWRAKGLVITNEAADDSNTGSFYQRYNQLKEVVDTTPCLVTINYKKGLRIPRMTYTSHLLCVNHIGNTRLDPEDRRFYVMQNTTQPASDEYFAKLNAWRAECNKFGIPDWLNHVGRWLMARKVDATKLSGRAPDTEIKAAMIEANQSPLDIAIKTILESIPTPYLSTNQAANILVPILERLNLSILDNKYKKIIKRELAEKTVSLSRSNFTATANGITVRPIARREDAADPTIQRCIEGKRVSAKDRKAVRAGIIDIDETEIRKKIVDALDEAGR